MRKIIALMVCTLFFAGQSTSELVVSANMEIKPEVGDYIVLEIIDLPDFFGEAVDEEKYFEMINIIKYQYRIGSDGYINRNNAYLNIDSLLNKYFEVCNNQLVMIISTLLEKTVCRMNIVPDFQYTNFLCFMLFRFHMFLAL